MLITINVLTIENASKSYGIQTLFKDLTFTITDTDKIGLIGINGTGKTTLMNIISGVDTPDTGTFTTMKNIRIEFLSQNPAYDSESTILEQVFKGDNKELNCIRDYENVMDALELHPEDENLHEELMNLSTKMTDYDLWDFESQIKTILTKLGVHDFHQKVGELSGGQRKRVALAGVLISPCDLLILDEPTNHMDNDTIDWLEDHLKSRKGALLMVTHDRYFLDRVVNRTIELDNKSLFSYDGNYSLFVEKKAERRALEFTLEQKRLNLYKNELAWIRRGAKARTTKQKARIQRFDELENTTYASDDEILVIPTVYSRLGNKIIELKNISKAYDGTDYIKDFSYTLLRNDRIGIVGDNGIGKSTLLNIITERLQADSGTVDTGATVKIGYFSQHSEDMDENLKAIEYIQEVADNIQDSDGNRLTASQIMEIFLFSKEMQWTLISKLSGGEKRRLYLLRVLIAAPNVLILDEPTNDIDLDTLKVLECYLDNFQGAVISVSHDRYFLDRTCKRIFAFEGNAVIHENTGNYTDYIEKRKESPIVKSAPVKVKAITEEKIIEKAESKNKLSYKEKLELDKLPSEIEDLEIKIEELTSEISKTLTDFEKLHKLNTEKDLAEELLLEKMERMEELSN